MKYYMDGETNVSGKRFAADVTRGKFENLFFFIYDRRIILHVGKKTVSDNIEGLCHDELLLISFPFL